MSGLAAKKGSLFGKDSGSSPTEDSPSPVVPKKPIFGAKKDLLSPEAKLKKQIEAKELLDRAEKHLATTVFKWKPDYVMAAPLSDQAAMCFKVGGFFRDAKDCYIKSSCL